MDGKPQPERVWGLLVFAFCLGTHVQLNFIERLDRQLGGWVNQAYSRLSTTHGHITDCKLDSVVYVGVCVVI